MTDRSFARVVLALGNISPGAAAEYKIPQEVTLTNSAPFWDEFHIGEQFAIGDAPDTVSDVSSTCKSLSGLALPGI